MKKLRDAAKALGFSTYEGSICKRGHAPIRLVSNGGCVGCMKISNSKWATNNPDKTSDIWKKWYAANSENVKNRQALAHIAHPERHRKRHGQPEPTRPKPDFCECCGKPPRKNGIHLDHCHLTGGFRGWLCGPCNQGIGLLGDTESGLKSAIEYLIRSKQ